MIECYSGSTAKRVLHHEGTTSTRVTIPGGTIDRVVMVVPREDI